MPENILWVFLHLPKTGGTTFNGLCYKQLIMDETFVLLNHWGKQYRYDRQRPSFHDRSIEHRNRVRVLSGHRTYYGIHRLVPDKEPRYLTSLRDPADRIVSRYNFWRSLGKINECFENWYQYSYKPKNYNPMVEFYANRLMDLGLKLTPEQKLNLAKQLLDRCWYIAITERLDNDLKYIFKKMGLTPDWENHRVAGQPGNALEGLSHPNNYEAIQKYFILDKTTREMIYFDHPLDVELYRYAKKINSDNNQQINRHHKKAL